MPLGYNERAWAIDVIAAINEYARTRRKKILRAGGEHTLRGSNSSALFPDVLLFGDDDGTRVRHGWELKFPDTSLDDGALVANAVIKANRLRVNSFVLWNVDRAVLYSTDDEREVWSITKEWGPLGVGTRAAVQANEGKWRALLDEILGDLNSFFEDGSLRSSDPADIIDDQFIADFLGEYAGVAGDALRAVANGSAAQQGQFQLWWDLNANSFREDPTKPINYRILASAVLVGWLNRFLFGHYLKGFRDAAARVADVNEAITPTQAGEIFDEITAHCDFAQLFKLDTGATAIGDEAWAALVSLNEFVSDATAEGVSQAALRQALEKGVTASRRKTAGQYTTPDNLAALLVAVTIEDRASQAIDPCCGTGTIAKAVFKSKVQAGQSYHEAAASVWASDKFQLPLQFATIALAEPEAMGEPLRVFRSDVFDLEPGMQVDLTDPANGGTIPVQLPKFQTVVSNLPFIRFETLTRHDPGVRDRFVAKVAGGDLDGRSDLFGFITLFLKTILAENARVGVIIGNSWLGTDWGEELRQRLVAEFHIEAVLTSGKGRWFQNADVVTNVLVLSSKPAPADPTRFITTERSIADWDDAYMNSLAAHVHASKASTEKPGEYSVRAYSQQQLDALGANVIGWSSFFSDISWLGTISGNLVPASSIFEINRGERRGWNDMFYPPAGHGIEGAYIKPVLTSMRNVDRLDVVATEEAFCCSATLDQLDQLGHTGARAWIERFRNQRNGNDVLLPEVLERAHHHWYEMKASTTAHFAAGMNPEDRIFISRFPQRSFVDQRIMRFTVRDANPNLDLLHALLNCTLSLFFVEASGFGRGLGALDTQPSKLARGMKLLDPAQIGPADRTAIIAALQPMKNRAVKALSDELASADRAALDLAVLNAFGFAQVAQPIRDSMKRLYRIRKSVKDD